MKQRKNYRSWKMLFILIILLLVGLYIITHMSFNKTAKRPCTIVYDKGGFYSDTCKDEDQRDYCIPEPDIEPYSDIVKSGIRIEGQGYCKDGGGNAGIGI